MMKRKTKKSETLQVRLPHGMKRDFMQRCETEGRAASDLIRDFIDDYLARPVEILTSEKAVMIRRTFVYPTLAAAALFGAVITFMPGSSQASSLREEFDAMDANKDGFVVASEYKAPEDGVTYSMGQASSPAKTAAIASTAGQWVASPSKAQQTIDKIDTDGDRRMSFEEHRRTRVGAAYAVFKIGDQNADKRLSKTEYVAGSTMPPQVIAKLRPTLTPVQLKAFADAEKSAQARFDRLDANNDGFLTLEEITPS